MAGVTREPEVPGDRGISHGIEPLLRFERPTGSLLGSLLVATPLLRDPSFERSVVLIVAHERSGAMGVVLNRATEVPVSDVLGEWAGLAQDPAVLFEGGPVQPDSAICVARARPGAGRLAGFQPFFGRLGTVDLGREPDQIRGRVDGVRVFAGYAGWSPQQLDGEVEQEAWITEAAHPDDPFGEGDLWARVLRRKGGEYALLARMPPDPSVN